ncbi:hypothetical protein Dde_1688 [Oleidesulfovibrio alaskensis G20]|jgi:hypothetical protein|uniref:Uncharacterized protein n=1 Tax=Oleidesulfovibrio alaskensis (strain ATCC BAA-1058 / DSM 17464 / G20) TaxID=207559 RepID=Q311B1_OLEA2|nr:hypothetical protein [Oleidesulfovibrio alaskensis]ABB38485.1 hypothetical protein Dde_1688 [Oleidesulfovibrio alaskensis G20]MBG0773502.1 hypothetical protein [Oleidesulfovibrio alaskensis]MBL3583294.1 hypothetical protein [Oleidesulfovibrio alaskensis]
MKLFMALTLSITLLAATAFAGQDPSSAVNLPPENPAVAAKLAAFASSKMQAICANIKPSPDAKELVQENGEYVARYLLVNTDNMTTKVKRSASSGKYVGIIRYHELVFEARGKTPSEALGGKFDMVKMRRITEIVRYSKGTWL